MNSATTKATRAILYLRFSPRPDAATSESNEVQEHYCKEYCERLGYATSEDDTHSDEATEGDDEDRPGLWAAVAATKRGCVLVVHKADRLARSVYLDEYVRRQIKRQGGRVEVVEGTPNGDTPADTLVRQIMAAVAQFEKKIIAARTKSSMLRHQKTGRAMGSVPPYGQQRGPDVVVTGRDGEQITRRTWVVNEAERVVIERIATLRAEGANYSAIARRLNQAEIPCRGREAWDATTIRRICRREGAV